MRVSVSERDISSNVKPQTFEERKILSLKWLLVLDLMSCRC